MSLWFKHDAHFHEHPKCLRLRRLAGAKADAAEVGWWRIVATAKRLGGWTFDDEDHLMDAAGRYGAFVPLYREVGFLDDLTIHNAVTYQGPKSDAERQAMSRAVRDIRHDTSVTPVTPREEKSREERAERADAPDPWDDPEGEAVTWLAKHGCALQPHSGYYRNLVTAVEVHGADAILATFDRLAKAGMKRGDVKGYIFGAIDALNAAGRPDAKSIAAAEAVDRERLRNQRALAATRARLDAYNRTPEEVA